MIVLDLWLATYAAGIVCLLGTGHRMYRDAAYVGRRRAPGRSTRRRARRWAEATLFSRRNREAFLALMTAAPPKYGHKAGVGRYAHLRPEELTETAERKLRVAEFKEARRTQVVDLAALRVRGAVPTTTEVDDEWLVAVS